MKLFHYALLLFVFAFTSCSSPKSNDEISSEEKSIHSLAYFTYQEANIFPGDGSLHRAKDGETLYIANLGTDLLKDDLK